ncbi:zinc-binding dehydrogenase [Sphingobacterium prati]
MGATVYTTARSVHHEFLKGLGADYTIDYEKQNYIDAILEMTNNNGVDVVIDTIGGTTLSDSGKILNQMGQVVTLVDIEIPQNLIHAWGKNATYHFVFTRQNRNKLDELTKLIESGKLKPVLNRVYPLSEIGKAHSLLEFRDSDPDFYGPAFEQEKTVQRLYNIRSVPVLIRRLSEAGTPPPHTKVIKLIRIADCHNC